jgi:hypothetical protein
LHLPQTTPALVLFLLLRRRVFVVLQPEAEPIDIALLNGMQVSRLPLRVRLIGEHLRIVRLALVIQVTHELQRYVRLAERVMHENRRFDLVDFLGDVRLRQYSLPSPTGFGRHSDCVMVAI